MKTARVLFPLILFVAFTGSTQAQVVSGELMRWHPISITFDGPRTNETATPNPFRDYRMDVEFTHPSSGTKYVVPGFFAADGNAAESSAPEGNKWRVYFLPEYIGEWTYSVTFRSGENIAWDSTSQGTTLLPHGITGTLRIRESDKQGRDFRGKGRLNHLGQRYLRFDNGEIFIKGGADSPENFLAFADFDNTYSMRNPGERRSGEADTAPVKTYQPHIKDWKQDDPSWKDGKGKGIIGALNYLASEEMNSVYFLTMNVEGDGKDVWPWIDPSTLDRYDVSKLDQWNFVFDHMDELGIMLHVVLTETENESLFEQFSEFPTPFSDFRKLYYRELIARFSHHPALVWNIGEENGWDDRHKESTSVAGIPNTHEQRRLFASYLRELDPYDHPVVVHTLPGRYDEIYLPLLGFTDLSGPSLQIGNIKDVHAQTLLWIERSQATGFPWFVCLDEIGPPETGVMPDGPDSNQDAVRRFGLWGNLMAGGAGVEWYFGYMFPHNDLGAEDWRSRDQMWDYTRHALHFFQNYLPFSEMYSADELTPSDSDYVFVKSGDIYTIYSPTPDSTLLVVSNGYYSVRWYNPREGGDLLTGSVDKIQGPGLVSLGHPPFDKTDDWVILVNRIQETN